MTDNVFQKFLIVIANSLINKLTGNVIEKNIFETSSDFAGFYTHTQKVVSLVKREPKTFKYVFSFC